jgi:hypothetical protein
VGLLHTPASSFTFNEPFDVDQVELIRMVVCVIIDSAVRDMTREQMRLVVASGNLKSTHWAQEILVAPLRGYTIDPIKSEFAHIHQEKQDPVIEGNPDGLGSPSLILAKRH